MGNSISAIAVAQVVDHPTQVDILISYMWNPHTFCILLFGVEKAWTQVHNLNQFSENLCPKRFRPIWSFSKGFTSLVEVNQAIKAWTFYLVGKIRYLYS